MRGLTSLLLLALPLPHRPRVVARDAAIVVVLAAVCALATNALRADGLPLVASEPYRIYVPCPEPLGDVEAMPASAISWVDRRECLVDARPAADWAAWHAPGAISVPYDFLDPVSERAVSDLLDGDVVRIVVYGDGQQPDTGRELARELAGAGVRGVHFVPGGAGAVRAVLEPEAPIEGAAPTAAPAGVEVEP